MFLSQLRSRLSSGPGRPTQRLTGRRSYPCLEGLEARCLLTINEFPTPTTGSGPAYITAGLDGSLWFTEYANP
jgi:hypothetical protein